MSLVEDLRYRGFVDRLSAEDIRQLSTHVLVETAKRLVVGPEAWSRPRIQRPDSQRHRAPQGQALAHIVLHPLMPPKLTPPVRTEVLRGGKYVLFSDGHGLGCWRVADDSLLGTYRGGLPSVRILDFAAEVLHGGDLANIVICIRSAVGSNA